MIYRAGSAVLRPLSRVLYRPTITGTAHVPREGAVILASNHLSFIDSIAIPLAAPRQVSFLAKSDYFTGAWPLGWLRKGFMEGVGAVPVDRNSSRAAQESLDIALDVLNQGKAFGIYPEGTRSRDGRLYRGRTGVGFLALTAGAPVVPVGLVGTDAIQPVGASWPRLAKVTVAFGAPIHPGSYADEPAGRARRRLTDDVMDAIAALTGQVRCAAYNELPQGDPS